MHLLIFWELESFVEENKETHLITSHKLELWCWVHQFHLLISRCSRTIAVVEGGRYQHLVSPCKTAPHVPFPSLQGNPRYHNKYPGQVLRQGSKILVNMKILISTNSTTYSVHLKRMQINNHNRVESHLYTSSIDEFCKVSEGLYPCAIRKRINESAASILNVESFSDAECFSNITTIRIDQWRSGCPIGN